ncbi:uncharacterized protein Z518_06154 [Rhinocladiella mackenziei CBS 650.93]|uniref:Uncharacterized protein n=1 Tax=Rhinocladiella mackenziei CBS 650.93 TaxID=1442369 RepID=A0A0D2FT41_9EURO|nr:uncharacterized protein Z518_06154 [Rhinocladiella mackenziei CBS 650.93]KIX05282.1 hypothetical protein Z518_06154 [Rhinocladiella mackenziei CBS 650.93]
MQTAALRPPHINAQPCATPESSLRIGAPLDEHAPLCQLNNLNNVLLDTSKVKEEIIGEAPPANTPAPQKKKSSIFGGLFQVREPTPVVSSQVAGQMIAHHGSISPIKVSNIRLEKMPDHMPKVNSKWDGIPQSVKDRGKKAKGKEATKSSKHESFLFSGSRSRSPDRKERDCGNSASRNSSSTTGSFGSRGRSSGSHTTSARTRFYAQSVNSSGDLASQQRTDRSRPRTASIQSQSLTSPSAISLPESLPEMPRSPPSIVTSSSGPSEPSRARSNCESYLPKSIATSRTTVDRSGSLKVPATPSIESVPPHSASPVATPQEASPVTPCTFDRNFESDMGRSLPPCENITLVSSAPRVLDPPTTAKKKLRCSINSAFLAGEAQELVLPDDDTDLPKSDLPLRNWDSVRRAPEASSFCASRVQQDLEKRPDSSRARLGLRASMLFRDENTPWTNQGKGPSSLPSPNVVVATSPRTISSPRTKFHKPFGLFGKEKDKN